ncbi:bifunctional phosphopantothenoylcysteine decarboxylase/phosphopantothenate--cysteine ligase CoaBC [Phenylobacterium sp.]|uniref:bifunctional phosphopantothenoylcysteine decarboxylase/phosphopantothenate--cysteine ligase CoaBC n=1 Tax=Phenylobacterium sp. TaxID=1871053 RepID=UPI002731D9E8|nr:bifunctional phosphopantothenoylcysteine decarboxylase/phosphopantothenate--cysteine ligase CoaBC [Phenylobacterium sp.]MDP1601024.1 bifunctional phosphopantothenoylcysteine decarboxylase/phosphopantothenate--cysteine ligase CoaBC [Phenylobacterium sp.]MDP3590803.1 bifunctional phosphopantothenoylcysteine decarboxylase/phosphopantothenate--cysteine ligase CoaBC [Phenylobacterium sp.]
MSEKRILLIVGGGIAAYKALELTRLLRKAGVGVRPILTQAGAQFVTPLSLAALSEDKVYSELFSLTDEAEMGHIELSRSADLVVVVPATADLMAKAANGHANDLASTTLLATDKPVLMAPAMNVRMWEHAATRRNLATLKGDGVLFVGPDEGAMACGEFGFGRMAEPAVIFEAIMAALAGPAARPLAGKRAIVTAGPTAEPIDPVRLLTNRSSGKQGFAIAKALADLGAEVTLVAGPVSVPTPVGVTRVDVETARQMLAACEAALPADIAVCVAAVSDWRPETAAGTKMKKGADGPPTISLVENPDILATLSQAGARRPKLVVGFAAETNDVETYAQAKLARKGCDWIVANDVSIAGTMGGDDNAVAIVSGQGIERWDRVAKTEVARKLAARMAQALD